VLSLPRSHDPLTLSFVLEGWLDVDGIKKQVSFTARLDGSGQVKVS
jgi:type VI secretion system protein